MAHFTRLVAAAAAVLALAPAVAHAQAGPGRAPGMPRQARELAGLNLTDAQRDQIWKLREDHRAAVRDEAFKLRTARRELRRETLAEQPDPQKIETLRAQVTELSSVLQNRRLELRQQMAQVLTPEQREVLRKRQDQRPDARPRRPRRLR